MRKTMLTLLGLALLATATIAGTIQGIVVNTDQEPVANAQVILQWVPNVDNPGRRPAPPRFVARAITGEDGRFTFDGLREGRYVIQARAREAGCGRTVVDVPARGSVRAHVVLNIPDRDNPPRRGPGPRGI